MNGQAGDFIKDWQVLAQQSWDAWMRQVQPPAAASPASAFGSDTLERTLAGLKGCFDWMQGVAGASASQPGTDWQSLLRTWAGSANQPFTQAFNGIDNAAARGFVQQWQAWLQSVQTSGFAMPGATGGPIPSFGLNREQAMQQQELAAAIQAALEASGRYQALIQRANTQGLERLQAKLTQPDPSSPPLESLKALYDLWVDVAEEAYAEVALSDEFRTAYGEMVNTQMRVRQMQQRLTGQLYRELGLPTREEVSSLGERLQQLRRDLRKQAAGDAGEEILALRREVAALKRELAALGAKPVAAAATRPKPVAKPAPRPAAKPKPAAKRSSASTKKAPARSKPALPVTRSRKR
ncbi:poly(R)-hydroxyalkanoic acid synthase subunit PhaE [Rhodanobacter sp. PCA2]|uniref:poly(R)-hydroxyalkanoic acid synthase subunit PhaE n=1 Tax=Rhodanobacter sp. PCA2 TaxID=2006117 RepID=UPI0015E6D70D|nr:poly(R)-hydroxyalkanoic acid synthase subunit PhaE [Rhodanobacter sp. PCA2]MBA2078738.1 pha synthase subunit protein [Rhodanobacter sp. PCA2]